MISLLLAVLCLITLLLFYIEYIQWKWEKEDRKLGIAGPKPLPLIGNLHQIWKAAKERKEYFKIVEYFEDFKTDTIRIRGGTQLVIFTKNLEVLETIANNPKFIKPREYDCFKVWLGDSLVITHGDRWYKLRKLLTPAFHFQILERFVSIFEEQSQILIQKLTNLKNGQIEDAFPLFHAFALDVIGEGAMGIKLNYQTQPDSEFVRANAEALNMAFERALNPLYEREWIWRLTSYYKRVTAAVKYIDNYMNKIIENRRKELLTRTKDENINNKSRPALLDILLQSEMDGKPLTNEDIRGEVNTFMFAGHETTGSTLCFAMYLLAKHPDVQKQLFMEITENGTSDKNKLLSVRSLNSYKFLDNVIKETLRLYPIFPMIGKMCANETRIGKLVIPANVTVVNTLWANHVDEQYFKNANEFHPDRWNDEVSNSERNPYAYQPFSAGLRNCIGQKFALLEAKTAVLRIISEFEVQLTDPKFIPDLKIVFSLRSGNGMPLKFIPRK